MPLNPYAVILFDLGGVLVELTGVPVMMRWLPGICSVEELWEQWLLSPAVRQFERGHTEPRAFAADMIAEFKLPVSVDGFLEEFITWPARLYPGVLSLLQQLAADYKVACLSNICDLHWERIGSDMQLGEHFDARFLSFQTGFLKPDREAFQHVVTELGCRPEQILFLDDHPLNIKAAKAFGMGAYRTEGIRQVEAVLAEIGLM
jgi:HAD superfamily hydrolase (TIGR01509 family)